MSISSGVLLYPWHLGQDQRQDGGTNTDLGLSFDRVEDHDNLMPILHHDTILKETYSEYFWLSLSGSRQENHAVGGSEGA